MPRHRVSVPTLLVHRVWLHSVLLLRVALWFVTTLTPWYPHLPMSRKRRTTGSRPKGSRAVGSSGRRDPSGSDIAFSCTDKSNSSFAISFFGVWCLIANCHLCRSSRVPPQHPGYLPGHPQLYTVHRCDRFRSHYAQPSWFPLERHGSFLLG